MIAANFRKFPEALLQQMELMLDEAAMYFHQMAAPLRAIWKRLLANRAPTPPAAKPEWFKAQQRRAIALAATVRAACLKLRPEDQQTADSAT
jgi:hypothetical protein